MLRTHRAGTGPAGWWGVGLRLNIAGGARSASVPGGRSTRFRTPAGSLGLSEQGKC